MVINKCAIFSEIRALSRESVVIMCYNGGILSAETPIMTDSASHDAGDKPDRLRGTGTLNPHPERVRDRRFAASDFFDPRDLLQVRYEMVRLVRIDRLTQR